MNDSMKRPRQMWKRRRPGDQFVIYVREAGMNGAKPYSLAYAQSRNEAMAIREQMEEYNPGLHVIVKPLPPSRRSDFLAPPTDGAKAVKLDAAGLASQCERLASEAQKDARTLVRSRTWQDQKMRWQNQISGLSNSVRILQRELKRVGYDMELDSRLDFAYKHFENAWDILRSPIRGDEQRAAGEAASALISGAQTLNRAADELRKLI